MKKQLFIFILIFIGIISIGCSSSNDDEVGDNNYKEWDVFPSSVVGDWRPVNANTKVSLTFEDNKNSPKLYITRSGRYFQGRPLYLKGGDGSFYFKFNGSESYSKLNYKKVVNQTYEFNLENSGDLNFKENFIKQ